MKAVDFDFPYLPQKLIGYHSNVPWAIAKWWQINNLRQHAYTNSETLMENGRVHSEIFGGICQFLPIDPKVAISSLVISGLLDRISPNLHTI